MGLFPLSEAAYQDAIAMLWSRREVSVVYGARDRELVRQVTKIVDTIRYRDGRLVEIVEYEESDAEREERLAIPGIRWGLRPGVQTNPGKSDE